MTNVGNGVSLTKTKECMFLNKGRKHGDRYEKGLPDGEGRGTLLQTKVKCESLHQ